MTWVISHQTDDGRTELADREGVSWWAAPIPRRWHRCRAQMKGHVAGERVQRCACGALSFDGRYWMDRNSRRRDR